jgi:hypothetical protein
MVLHIPRIPVKVLQLVPFYRQIIGCYLNLVKTQDCSAD